MYKLFTLALEHLLHKHHFPPSLGFSQRMCPVCVHAHAFSSVEAFTRALGFAYNVFLLLYKLTSMDSSNIYLRVSFGGNFSNHHTREHMSSPLTAGLTAVISCLLSVFHFLLWLWNGRGLFWDLPGLIALSPISWEPLSPRQARMVGPPSHPWSHRIPSSSTVTGTSGLLKIAALNRIV